MPEAEKPTPFTPGLSVASWMKLRPLSGSWFTSFSFTTVPIEEDSDSSSGAWAVTSTASDTCPNCRVKFISACWLICKVNPFCTSLRKPLASAATV